MLRYLSKPCLLDYSKNEMEVQSLVRALENLFVKEGYLLGIPLIGMNSAALRPLLQVS